MGVVGHVLSRTIGIAIASSPLAVLAYIGEKIYTWSDPERVEMQDILDTVALYILSGSFATSVVIYNQVFQVLVPIYQYLTRSLFLSPPGKRTCRNRGRN